MSEEVANVNNLTKKPQNTQNDIIDFGQLARKREQSKKLREVITPILNFDTIRTICLDLGIEYENLGGENVSRDRKVEELFKYLDDRERISLLEDWVRNHYPQITISF